MDINWFEAMLYGFVSGITEFLPVSAQAHQMILLNLFGCDGANGILSLMVHLGMFIALYLSSNGFIRKEYREYKLSKSSRRRRKREVNMQSVFNINLVKAALIPFLIGFLFYPQAVQWSNSTPVIALLLLVNGVILHIPIYLARGNKDSRNMSAFDGVLFGVGSALSVLPGISRIGSGCSVASARGADPQQAFKWSLVLSIPAIILLMCYDTYAIFTAGFAGIGGLLLLKSIISGLCAYLGASFAITIVKTIAARSGLSGFSYYCWGAALFAFILYLY